MNTTTDALPFNVHPIGAALTVAYGSYNRPFCSLADIYRILRFLTGYTPHNALWVDACFDHHRAHVLAALPDALKAIDPPPDTGPDGGDTADVAWVAGIKAKYGPTVKIPPTPETPRS